MSSLRFPSDSPGYHRFPSSRHLKMNKRKFRPYNRQYNDSDSKTSWLKTWSELKLIAKEFRINMSLEFIQLNYLLSKVCWSSWMVVRRTWNCFLRSSNWRSVKKKKKEIRVNTVRCMMVYLYKIIKKYHIPSPCPPHSLWCVKAAEVLCLKPQAACRNKITETLQ